MTSMQQKDRLQAHRLKRNIKRLIQDQLHSISPCWLISFHYRDHHANEDKLLVDVADLKRKLHRIIYKSRDKSIKGAGKYPYPRMLFIHETSHQGTGQFHTHLIVEKLPASLNTQYEMEILFRKRLPHKVKALSRWKSIDIQRIHPDEADYRRISSYLGKQTSLEMITLDPFNSDLSKKNEKTSNHHHLPTRRRSATPSDTASTEEKSLPKCLSILPRSHCRETGATGGSQMKTIIIRLPDVEAAMLYELQKYDKKYSSLASMLGAVIANDYRALKGGGRGG